MFIYICIYIYTIKAQFGVDNVMAAKEVYLYILIYTNVYICMYINVYLYIYMHRYMYIYKKICTHTYIYAYIVYIHMYIYINI
jgi:hypothetical protein